MSHITMWILDGLRTRMLVLFVLASLRVLVAVPEALGHCTFPSVNVDAGWSAEQPCRLDILVAGDYVYESCCGDPVPFVRILILDESGDEIYTFPDELLTEFTAVSDEQSGPFEVERYYDTQQDAHVCHVVAECWCTGQTSPEASATDAVDSPGITCSHPQAAWNCYLCSDVGEIADTSAQAGAPGLKYYKSAKTLYTLPNDDTSGTVHGEAVNGEFVAEMDGWLFVNATPNSIVNMKGSAAPDGAGWMTPSGRQGTAIDAERCLELTGGQRFKFNLLAGRGDLAKGYSVAFDWYWWDSVSCCLQHDRKVLSLQVEPLPCVLEKLDPITPQRQDWVKSDATKDIELRIPCCGGEQTPGNLSLGFIVWPVQTDTGARQGQILVVPEGHAKGWKTDGTRLIGPNGLEYEFTD